MASQLINERAALEYLDYCEIQFKDNYDTLSYVHKRIPRQNQQSSPWYNIIPLIIHVIVFIGSLAASITLIIIKDIQDIQDRWTDTSTITAGVFAFPLVFSLFYMCFIGKSGKAIQAMTTIFTAITAIILAGVSFYLYDKALSIPMFLLSCTYIFFICFYFEELNKIKIMLLSIAEYITCKVHLAAFFVLSITFLVLFPWILAFLYQEYDKHKSLGFQVLLSFIYLFFLLSMHYTSTYISACLYSLWFYQYRGSESSLDLSLRLMLKGFGTIGCATFVNPLMMIIKFLYYVAKLSQTNCCFGCLTAALNFINSYIKIEMWSQTFNDYTIIVSALTGQSYLKSSVILAHCSNITNREDTNENPSSFLQKSLRGFRIIQESTFVFRFVFVFFVGSMTILLYLVLLILFNQTEFKIQGVEVLPISILTIFFGSIAIANSFIQIYINPVQTFYLIYRLDAKITVLSEEHKITWYKDEVKTFKYQFNEAFSGLIPEIPKVRQVQIILQREKPGSSNRVQNQALHENQQQNLQQNAEQNRENGQGQMVQDSMMELNQQQRNVIEEVNE